MLKMLKAKASFFLSWAEEHIKTDLHYLVRNGSWLTFGQFASSLSAFFLSVAFANLFPKEAYGEYRYIFSLVGVAGAFSLTGMDAALSQAIARGLDGTLDKGARAMFYSSFLCSAVLLGMSGYYFFQHNAVLGWGLIIAAIATPLLKTFNLYGAFLIGKKDFSRKTYYGVVYDVVPTLALIAALFLTKNSSILVIVYFVAYTVIAGILYFSTKRVYPSNGAADHSAISYSLHLSGINFLGSISSQLDKILTFHYLGAAQLAVYSFAIGMPQQLRQLQKIVTTIALPRFSAHTFNNVRKEIHRKALYLFCGMLPICLAYIISAPFLFRLLFPQYIDSVLYSQVFSLILLFAPGALYQQVLVAHKHQKGLYVIQTLGSSIRIALLALFVWKFGIWGIILSTFVSEALRLGLVLYFIENGPSD